MGISCPKPHTWPTEGQKKKENRQDTSRENPLESLREDMAGPRQAQSHGRTSLLISVTLPTNTPWPPSTGRPLCPRGIEDVKNAENRSETAWSVPIKVKLHEDAN